MKISSKILIALNKCFKAPIHPFNLQKEGIKSHAMWQYEKGADTIKFYLKNGFTQVGGVNKEYIEQLDISLTEFGFEIEV